MTLVFAAAALVLAAAATALATHPRPKGATPLKVSLVPAYEPCTSPNRTHGPPLAFPSCSPPVQASSFLTVGTPDANGAAANSVGSVKIRVIPGNPGPPQDADVQIIGQVTDVRCKPATSASVCNSPNASDGPDYSGELEGFATIRVTDHDNATTSGGGPDPATMVDLPFPFQMTCANTPDTSVGATCQVPPPSCLGCPPPEEGNRAVIEMAQIQIRDGGPDGVAATQDNTLFMVQGVFLP